MAERKFGTFFTVVISAIVSILVFVGLIRFIIHAAESNHRLSVEGSAELTVAPEAALVSVYIVGASETVSGSRDAATTILKNVVDAAKNSFPAIKEVHTQELSVTDRPELRFVGGTAPAPNNATITTILKETFEIQPNIEQTSRLLDSAVKAGAKISTESRGGSWNSDSGPVWYVKREISGDLKTLQEKALADARRRAEEIATAQNIEILQVTDVSFRQSQTVEAQIGRQPPAGFQLAAKDPQSLKIAGTASVTFDFRNKKE